MPRSPGGSRSVAVTGRAAGRPVPYRFPEPSNCWAAASNTGYLNALGYPGSLTDGSGVTIQSNTTYSFMSFPVGVNIGGFGSPVTNVTLYGCLIESQGDSAAAVLLYGDGIALSYCTIAPVGLPAPPVSHAAGYQYGIEGDGGFNTSVQRLTVNNCEIYGFANAIDVTGGTAAKPHKYIQNWVHDPRNDGGLDHTDGIGCLSGSGSEDGLVLSCNNIQGIANTNAIAYQGGTWSNVTVSGNLLGGYGYTVAFQGTSSNIAFTGNTYSTALLPDFGPLYPSGFPTSPGSTWSGNKWLVPPGAQWGHAQYSGYFWLPGITGSASPSLDELAAGLVSTTDF